MTSYGHYFDEATKEIHAPKVPLDKVDRGLGYILYHSMKKSAAKGLIAQIDAATGQRDCFQSVFTRCIRVAISLRNLGVKRGDIITSCSNNHLNNAVATVAGFFIGATISTTDPSMSLDEQRHALNIVKPKVIFVSEGSEDLILQALAGLEFKCEMITFASDKISNCRNFHSMVQEHHGEDDFQPVIVEDQLETCVILFSSGTTGLAKGICVNHYMILNSSSFIASIIELNPRVMFYASLYWIGGLCLMVICFQFGLERVVCSHYDPALMWGYIHKYQVQLVYTVSSQTIHNIQYLELKQFRKTNPLMAYITTGSPISSENLQRLRELLPDTLVVAAYGQSEAGFISIFLKRDENYSKLTSVGVLKSNLIAKVVDPDTEEPLGLNKPGEIVVKTPYAMNSYLNQDSSSCWTADGFLKTGDVGYFDDDLCLFVTDRIKEMFKYQGWHIIPAKIEAILESHPAVQMAIVVGIPHPIDEHHAVGGVTLMPDATVSGYELEKYVEERVSGRNRLRAGVVILEHMPLTTTGKTNRRVAKEKLINMVTLPEDKEVEQATK